MNCKPGDLAFWVRRGVLVTVVRRTVVGAVYQCTSGTSHRLDLVDAPAWDVEMVGAPQHWTGAPEHLRFTVLPVRDSGLRPIRDQPGTDEMLRIAGLPQDHKQPQEA